MDASPLFDPEYLPIILGTLVGFGVLAVALLLPVYRFLEREQEVAEEWTPEALAQRMREQQEAGANGTGASDLDADDADGDEEDPGRSPSRT